MDQESIGQQPRVPMMPGEMAFDPFSPLLKPLPSVASGIRQTQRIRRSRILAAVRRLLAEEGCDAVSMRRIAEGSDCSVQTIYNLVGPRNQAISEAISEYSLFVGRSVKPRPDNPGAVLEIANSWVVAIERTPEFCRQANLIFFTASRGIYYRFRERQLRGMRHLLGQQKQSGIIKSSVDTRALAENLVFLSGGLIIDWSDRPFPLGQLHEKICSGYATLLSASVDPSLSDWVQDWRTVLGQRSWHA